MQLRANWKSGIFFRMYCPKGLEKTEFAPTLTFPEAKVLSRCQGSSEGIYGRSSKTNQWRNYVNIGRRKKAPKLEVFPYILRLSLKRSLD